MRVIISEENKETILINDVTERYVIVGIIGGQPCILSKDNLDSNGFYKFKPLDSLFTGGNYMCIYDKGETVIQCLTKHIEAGEKKIHAFKEKDWKEALQWLIENAK